MPSTYQAGTAGFRLACRITAFAVAVIAAVGTVSGCSSTAGSSHVATPTHSPQSRPSPPPIDLRTNNADDDITGLGAKDGDLPDGVSAFADEYPAIANLDPGLLGALREAATDAARRNVEFIVNSGWRSSAYQEHLLDVAIGKYGSRKKAARWVATPMTSAHVSGDAVDIGPSNAETWLAEHGAEYGLCQIYLNEPWHYELRPRASEHGCPRPYADPAHDPRMQ